MSRKKSNPESGYALLLVFAMAAIVAITLYTEVPRVAFEAQRDKEDLLMSRGHEYMRGISLFVRKFNRFPASMDELENTNRMRFLRRRYADPMTGKTDWRLLHAGPGGTIIDSITSKKKDAATQQNFITELQMFGAAPAGQEDSVNLATRKRASDQSGTAGGGGGELGTGSTGVPDMNPPPVAPVPAPVMVLPDGSIVPANPTGMAPTGAQQAGGPQGFFGIPGMPGASGNGRAMQPNGMPMPAQLQQLQNGQYGGVAPGQQGPPASAASLINQILTSPRPGGINGLPGQGLPGQGLPGQQGGIPGQPGVTAQPTGAQNPTPAGQQVIGGGLAGVASKREQEGIKTYNQRVKYNEWEFVYDISKDPTKTRQAGVAGATGAQGSTGATASPPVPTTAPTGFGPQQMPPGMPMPVTPQPGVPTTPGR